MVGEGEGGGSYKQREKVRSEWKADPPARKLSAPQNKVRVGQGVREKQLSPSLLLCVTRSKRGRRCFSFFLFLIVVKTLFSFEF